MKKIVPQHPLAIRWMHWINFPVLFVMIWSGMLIYWANDVYKIHLGHTVFFSFFPPSFYRALNFSYRLAEGMAFHFIFMWIFFINGIGYVLYTLFSGEWRYLVPTLRSFKDAWLVLLHDLHLRKTAPPQGKYNAAQKIAYTGIIILGFGSIMTGLAIYKPIQFQWITTLFGGYGNARVIHFILTIGYCLFFLIHVIQVILAGWNNFQAMVTGFEVANFPAPTISLPPEPATPAPASTEPAPLTPEAATTKTTSHE
jgi:thiosulfate reductase cytochrome b subunit